ncbi:site-specific integrase [Puia sp. P3]|uniref:site-specific integrase n=1 Tax=Puia sp. P3 TaxID=3423952 RepID=UPI003D67B1E7
MEFDARIPVQSFLDYLKFEKRYSAHTIRSYQDDLVAFLILSSWSLGEWGWGR